MFEFKFIGLLASLLLSDPIAETQSKLNEIDRTPPSRIEPIPVFTLGEPASYTADKSRNPFFGKTLYRELSSHTPKKAYVNLARPKQPLEHFPIETLEMTGVLKKGKTHDAMMRTPDGALVVVSMGDYIGENHGRITKIDPTGMEVIEAAPDGKGNYWERPRGILVVEVKKEDGM